METLLSDVPPPPAPMTTVEDRIDSVPSLDQPYYRAPLTAAFVRFWKKYATFTGRASRAEFWWWALVWAAVGAAATLAGEVGGPVGSTLHLLQELWIAAALVPFAALLWRRLHDSNVSGWWSLPFLVQTVYVNATIAFGLRPFPQFWATAVIVGVIVLGLNLQILVLTLRGPRAEGARFDK